MARIRTSANLILDVRQRAGMENSDFVSDPFILELLNQERAELNWHLRLNEGQPHDYATADIAVVAGTVSYATPADFWELLGAKAVIGGLSREMVPFMEGERPELQNSQVTVPFALSPRYRLVGPQIDVLPSTNTFTMTIRYVPSAIRMDAAGSMDGWNGYELACIYGAVAACLAKEESDPSYYEGLKARILRMVDALAAQRDAGHPERVTDVIGLDNALGLYPFR